MLGLWSSVDARRIGVGDVESGGHVCFGFPGIRGLNSTKAMDS